MSELVGTDNPQLSPGMNTESFPCDDTIAATSQGKEYDRIHSRSDISELISRLW